MSQASATPPQNPPMSPTQPWGTPYWLWPVCAGSPDPRFPPTLSSGGAPPYRRSHLADPNARAPGHHLCTVYFKAGVRSYCLQMVEGLARDTIIFRGISRVPKHATVELFNLSGPGVDIARDLGRAMRGVFPVVEFDSILLEIPDRPPLTLPRRTLTPIPMPALSADGISPDSLLLQLEGENCNIDEIVVAGFSEGIATGTAIVILGGLAILVGGALGAYQIYQTGGKSAIKARVSIELTTGKLDGQFELSGGPGTSK